MPLGPSDKVQLELVRSITEKVGDQYRLKMMGGT